MGARPDRLEEADEVLDVLVEAEAAVLERHIARVVPVGDVDVVVGQHRAHGAAQQRREMARQRRHQEHAWLRVSMSFLKCSSVPNGVVSAALSCTATSRLPTLTLSIAKAGRAWVSPARAMIS